MSGSAVPATDREIAGELQKLRAIFGYEADRWKTAVGLYFDALADLPITSLRAAVMSLIRNNKFFPMPAEIREAAFAAMPKPLALPPPEHRPFPDNNPVAPEDRVTAAEMDAILRKYGLRARIDQLQARRPMLDGYAAPRLTVAQLLRRDGFRVVTMGDADA